MRRFRLWSSIPIIPIIALFATVALAVDPRVFPLNYNESTCCGSGPTDCGGAPCDYTSVATWESATDNDLVSAQAGEVLTVYASGGPFASATHLSGATTNSSYYRVVRGLPQHGGGDTDSMSKHFDGNRYPELGSWVEDYVQFWDIVTSQDFTTVTVGAEGAIILYACNGCKIINCVAIDVTVTHASYNAVGFRCHAGSGDTCWVINSVAHNVTATGTGATDGIRAAGGGTQKILNCTAAGAGDYGIRTTSTGTDHLRNSIAQSNGTDDINGTWSVEQTNADNAGVAFANYAGNNFDLASGDSVAKDNGTNLHNAGTLSGNEDYATGARSVSAADWDIGAHEYGATFVSPHTYDGASGSTISTIDGTTIPSTRLIWGVIP